MNPGLPEGMGKSQLFRMDGELAIRLREGHKDEVLGTASSFGLDSNVNSVAYAAEVKDIKPVSSHHHHVASTVASTTY